MPPTIATNVQQGQAPSKGSGAPQSAKPQTLDAAGIKAAFAQVSSSAAGLTSADAEARLAQYGPNLIRAHEESRWHKLLGYFWGPIPWMIEAAALISLARKDWPDFFVVTGLLLYNAAVGFWQDNKAASALAALKKGLALKARVLRGGAWSSIDAGDLVPGDVVSVSGGEILPADLLLTEGKYLSVDQAALTGESLPVSKRVGDSAYSGSIAKQGAMTGLVTGTGNNTFFGRTAKLVASAGAKSHAEQAVLRIGDFLILLAAALALVLVATQVHRDIDLGGSWSWTKAGLIAQFVLVLLVASVPVAMPAVMSVTMALGALALSKQKAIVSRLSADRRTRRRRHIVQRQDRHADAEPAHIAGVPAKNERPDDVPDPIRPDAMAPRLQVGGATFKPRPLVRPRAGNGIGEGGEGQHEASLRLIETQGHAEKIRIGFHIGRRAKREQNLDRARRAARQGANHVEGQGCGQCVDLLMGDGGAVVNPIAKNHGVTVAMKIDRRAARITALEFDEAR
jgi:hypothetical protein